MTDVAVDAPAQAHRRHQRREIVVDQHQGGSFAGDVRAAAAHRHADVRGAQRRSVVDAVAGHRDDIAIRLEGLHQAQLVLGLRARVDVRCRARARAALRR